MRGAAGLGQNTLQNGVTVGQGFGIEFLVTFVLILVIMGAAADEDNSENQKGSAPLAIGLSITTCHLFAVSSDHFSKKSGAERKERVK